MIKLNNIYCYYANSTSKMQTIRVVTLEERSWEKMVFPGERLLFEALVSSHLEIYTSAKNGEVLLKKIACERLRVREENMGREFDIPSHWQTKMAN